MKPSREGYIPTYPEFIVNFAAGKFSSSLKTLRVSRNLHIDWHTYLLHKPLAFDAGEQMAPLKGFTKALKAYTTVQCGSGPHDHIELNSDLVYGT